MGRPLSPKWVSALEILKNLQNEVGFVPHGIQELLALLNNHSDYNFGEAELRSFLHRNKLNKPVYKTRGMKLGEESLSQLLHDKNIAEGAYSRLNARWETHQLGILEAFKDKPIIPSAPTIENNNAGRKVTMFLCLGDWHYGLFQSTKESVIAQEFNSKRLTEMVKMIDSKVYFFKELYGNFASIDDLVIFLLGDFCEGAGMRATQGYEIDVSPEKQITDVYYLLENFLESQMRDFQNVRTFGVFGNHRMFSKGQLPETYKPEYFIYERLKGKFDVDYALSNKMTREIDGINFLIGHGDYVRGSISRLKRLQAYSDQLGHMKGKLIDFHISAHSHTPEMAGRTIINGGLAPYYRMAEDSGYRKSPPSQHMFLIDQETGNDYAHTDLYVE